MRKRSKEAESGIKDYQGKTIPGWVFALVTQSQQKLLRTPTEWISALSAERMKPCSSLDDDAQTAIPITSLVGFTARSRASSWSVHLIISEELPESERVAAEEWGNVLSKYTWARVECWSMIYIKWNAQILSVQFQECSLFYIQVKPSR